MTLQKLATQSQMKPHRVVTALSVITVLVALQLWQTVKERDDWPLSSFPMYSWLSPRVAVRYALVGVTPQGEVELQRAHTWPLTGARLRNVVSARGGKAAKHLVTTICSNLKRAGAEEEFSAIRLYRRQWKPNPELKGLNSKGSLSKSVDAFCPERLSTLKSESKHQIPAASAVTGGANDIVLEADQGVLSGDAEVVTDTYASGGRAVVMRGKSAPKKPDKNPATKAVFTFNAPAGRYTLWLRAKTSKGKANDSVWIQTNKRIGTTKTSWKTGIGNFRGTFPANAFTWSSRGAAGVPAHIRFKKSGKQTLQVSLREGPISVDQIVLSKSWPEHPLHNRPVKK